MKATNEELVAAYLELKSCWKVGERFGMCGQGVHTRLKKLGVIVPIRIFSESDRIVLRENYEHHADAGKLDDLAKLLGRTRQFICRIAREEGLTNQCRPRSYFSAPVSIMMKKWMQENPHPKGMLGKKHSVATKAKMSQHRLDKWAHEPQSKKDEVGARMSKIARLYCGENRKGASWKAAWREIGGRRGYYRSAWEANYARYLEWLKVQGDISDWEHEPETFWFEGIKRGVMSYLPDFRVTEIGGAVTYHEVKGWMDARSVTIFKRMRIYHPMVRLVVIDSKNYKVLKRQISMLVPGWED